VSGPVILEHDGEPVRGLPGHLPPGEHILWQGAPAWRRLARTAFHVPMVAIYFGLILGSALIAGASASGLVLTLVAAVAAIGLLVGIAVLSARTTVYTLTNRRVVLRFGIALGKCVNVPLVLVAAAAVQRHSDGTGDIALTLTGANRIGYLLLWPHARPWYFGNPQPMLRAVPEADRVAALLARTLVEVGPAGNAAAAREAATPAPGRPVAPGRVAAPSLPEAAMA
jgi:hypothetical protein